MDLNMPVMDGIEATKAINERIARGKVPPTPIVALTGGSLTEEEEKNLREVIGFAAYYSKPIPKKVLEELLTLLLIS